MLLIQVIHKTVNKFDDLPAQTRKYDVNIMKKIFFAEGTGTEMRFSFRFGGSRNRNGILYRNSIILLIFFPNDEKYTTNGTIEG